MLSFFTVSFVLAIDLDCIVDLNCGSLDKICPGDAAIITLECHITGQQFLRWDGTEGLDINFHSFDNENKTEYSSHFCAKLVEKNGNGYRSTLEVNTSRIADGSIINCSGLISSPNSCHVSFVGQ